MCVCAFAYVSARVSAETAATVAVVAAAIAATAADVVAAVNANIVAVDFVAAADAVVATSFVCVCAS